MNPTLIIETLGLLGIFLIIFAESGLFFGFFLPGDTLLFIAGIFASQGDISIQVLIIVCIFAAVIGDSVGYWTGKHFGPRLFNKDKGFFFKKKRLDDARVFYDKHGKYTIILARFLPVIRTFAPIVAGMGRMPYQTFLKFNILGGLFWVSLMTLLGYFLGNAISNPDAYILPIVIAIFFISFIPLIIQFIARNKKG